jgi:hypothetical protein
LVLFCICGALGIAAARELAPASKQQCIEAYSDAQELRLKGALLAARERLLVCSQSSCPGPVVKDCVGWLSDVDGSLPSVVFALSDGHSRDLSEVRVSANQQVVAERTDGRAVVLDPGEYTFTFEAPGYERAQRTVAMRQSEKNRIVRVKLTRLNLHNVSPLTVSPQQPGVIPLMQSASASPSEASWPVITAILGGVALGGVGTFAYFGLQGLDKRRDAERCAADCRELITTGKRDYVVADLALGVAIAAAASAVLVYFLVEAPSHASTAKEGVSSTAPPSATDMRDAEF